MLFEAGAEAADMGVLGSPLALSAQTMVVNRGCGYGPALLIMRADVRNKLSGNPVMYRL